MAFVIIHFLLAVLGSAHTSPANNGQAPGSPLQILKKPFPADDRITALVPNGDVEVAQPAEITIEHSGGEIAYFDVMQSAGGNALSNQQDGKQIGGEIKLLKQDATSRTFQIIPLHPGKIDIAIIAMFKDGGQCRKTFPLEVRGSSKGLKKFFIAYGSHALPIVLRDDKEDRHIWLFPELYYANLDYPIHLHDSTALKFTVEQPKDPVIRLEANGMIYGLRPGKAKIIAEYAGVQDWATVTVYTKESAPLGE